MFALARMVVLSMAVVVTWVGGNKATNVARHSIPVAGQCAGENSLANETIGSSMLQIATQKLKVTERLNKTMFGVPILMGTSVEADTSENDWVVVMKKDNIAEGTVHQICESTSNCSGEALALGLIRLHGTDQELKDFVGKNRDKIEYVEVDGVMKADPDFPREGNSRILRASGVKSWGLDRIDARSGLDDSYTPPGREGEGVHVYVLDTGIRATHKDFGGRVIPTLECLNHGFPPCQACNNRPNCAHDAHGHGTHCAGTIGGNYLGVAKKSILHAVSVLDNNNEGIAFHAAAALDWIVLHGERPAVVSGSISYWSGGSGRHHYAERAVESAFNNSVVFVVSAGNENADACGFTFGYIPKAINVGATQSDDKRWHFSNYGRCIDIFAPGRDIISAGHRNDRDWQVMSGTSMACPHVSGAVALLLGNESNLSPAAITQRIISSASKGKVVNVRGSPNEFLYVQEGSPPNSSMVSYWTPWGSANLNGVVRPDIVCNPPHGERSAIGFEYRTWLGIVGAKLKCADGTILRTGSNRRNSNKWGYCNDNFPRWLNQSEWIRVRYQSRFGLVNAACGIDDSVNTSDWVFNSNWNGQWKDKLRCNTATDWFDGIQVREQKWYGIVNLRMRCSGYRFNRHP